MSSKVVWLRPNRPRITDVSDPDSAYRVRVRHPNLQGVAQGYRQHQTLQNLLSGAWVRNPAYWHNGVRRRPRRSELQGWLNFRERLLAEGYGLEVHREPYCADGDELYRLLVLGEVEPS